MKMRRESYSKQKMQHAQHKENDFLAAGCVRIGREKKKIEEERKEGKDNQLYGRNRERNAIGLVLFESKEKRRK